MLVGIFADTEDCAIETNVDCMEVTFAPCIAEVDIDVVEKEELSELLELINEAVVPDDKDFICTVIFPVFVGVDFRDVDCLLVCFVVI